MPNPRVVWTGDPPHLKEAFKTLGLSEIAGPRHEKKVLQLYAEAGHPEVKQDEVAWCAAWANAMLYRAGFPITGSLMARSFVNYGKKLNLKKKLPRGAIIVWPRGTPPSGHVNILLEDTGANLVCIGGNQGNGKGGGVTISTSAKDQAIAAVWPPGLAMPSEVPLPKPKPDIPEDEPPLPAPKPQPDDPGPEPEPDPEPAPKPAHVPWWKRPFVWIGGLLTGGGFTLGGASLSIDGQFWIGLGACVLIVFLVFLGWVYLVPPRGQIKKGLT